MAAIENRYDFVFLFDVENGNPNGDPDAGNMPRNDAETGHGYVTDGCIKRKLRNFVEETKCGEDGYEILIKSDRALNDKFSAARKVIEREIAVSNQETEERTKIAMARDYMCRRYYDVRTFGAVMNTGKDVCGSVRGPVQINFARSINPVNPQEITITRRAITTPEKFDDVSKKTDNPTEMGKKQFVPYALYRAEGYVSAALAQKSGFSEEDLDLLWTAIENMFELDHSAVRGKMVVRGLYVFKHDSLYGNAHSDGLFDKIKIHKSADVEYPRSFSDYAVEINGEMPKGITLIKMI